MMLPGGGLDLATEWRSRRWRRLLNIIDRLPRTSAYVEAMIADEQLAEQLIDDKSEDERQKPSRRMSDWSVEVELLTYIFDRLGELTQAVAALGGAKPRQPQRAPYPATAMQRVRERRRKQRHLELVARVLPHRAGRDNGSA